MKTVKEISRLTGVSNHIYYENNCHNILVMY